MAAPVYNDAAGLAAQRYLEGLQRSGQVRTNVLPATFRWQECFDLMVAAATAPCQTAAGTEGLRSGDLQRTVADLQRELLAICKGGRWADAWRQLNAPVEWPLTNLGKRHRVDTLRALIRHLDPKAALYYGWAGPDDDDPNRPHRRKGEER